VSRLAAIRKGVGQFERKFQGKGSSMGNIFLGFYKIRHLAIRQSKLHRATCRRFDTIPACDGQTDGIAVASTALAKRRAVKNDIFGKS